MFPLFEVIRGSKLPFILVPLVPHGLSCVFLLLRSEAMLLLISASLVQSGFGFAINILKVLRVPLPITACLEVCLYLFAAFLACR